MSLNEQIAELTHHLEICNALKHRKPVQFRARNFVTAKWRDVTSDDNVDEANFHAHEWRLKPEPKTVPWTQEDVPPVCWLRKKRDSITWLVSFITSVGAGTVNSDVVKTYDRLAVDYEYSIDLKTWRDCTKEVLE